MIYLLTTGETHFFRDTAQFEALATQILPADRTPLVRPIVSTPAHAGPLALT
jgi:chemotaxis methyl-accepting protein methylase